MKKKYKLPLILIVMLILIIAILIGFKFMFKDDKKTEVKVVDSIKEFGYTLDKRDSKLMKNTYEELKKVLNETEIDNEEYAKVLAKLFVIDLFTMDNKLNKYDVGATEYVYPDNLENFKLNVENTIYKTVESKTSNSRGKLPIVSSVNVDTVKNGEFNIGEETKKSYIVNLTWEYEEDLGYDKSATITFVQVDKYLYVVEYNRGESNE